MTTSDKLPIRVCLVTFGSAGDVHPMLALGQGLRARGHGVTLISNPAFAGMAASAGLDFIPAGLAQDYQATIEHPKLWHPIDGFGVMWRYLLRPALAPTYGQLVSLNDRLRGRERIVLVANPVAMGARVAQEKLGLPLVSAYTAATMLRTVCHPMTLAQWRVPAWCPAAARRLAWAALDRYKLEPLVRPALDALRHSLALPPLREPVFGQWVHSPQAGVTLFPDWFAAAPRDWPRQVVQAGFALYDGPAPDIPADLQAFLAQGPAPVVFMPGTAMWAGDAFFDAALRACERTGQRGVLLGRVGEAVRLRLPAHVFAAPYAPFGWLLPRSRALVHHGGIGSCAQALRAGIAQLVVPHAYDQFDNAMRLEHLGVGRMLGHEPSALADMGEVLAQLLGDSAVAQACARWSAQTTPDAARSVVADLVERLA